MVILLVLLAILGVVIWGGILLDKYQKEAKALVAEGGIEAFMAEQTSIIYDADGKEITNLIGSKDVYYLKFDKIPYMVKRALITSEDRNFYNHSGIDYKAVVRAMVELVKNKGDIQQGGSTITQQLARNVFLTHDISYERKLKEMMVAREIERIYDKDTILEFYINNIYFANGMYGIQAAAKGYFSKSIEKLSLSQMVFLCAIPNNPSLYDPYLHMENTLQRRDRILKQMYEQGDIDEQLYQTALKEKIVLKPAGHTTNNYVETYVRHCATLALMESTGFEFQYSFADSEARELYYEAYYEEYDKWSSKLYTGGYRIYTSIDMKKQAELQRLLDEKLSPYTEQNEEGVYKFQGAAACIDNRTGRVIAIVGGRSDKNSGYTINRAYQSHRQPGSTIKPILVYTPMLERGYNPDTIVSDQPVKQGPVNEPNIYEGDITLRYAVEKSKNTVAWQLFEMLTPQVGLSYLHNMNFTRIVREDYVPAASIGGLTYGVSPVEMAEAFATLENDGIFRTATCIVRITDAQKNPVIESASVEKQIYNTNAARMMTDILKGVLVRGTGANYQVQNAICAAKTGTTNENKDVWFVGYSSYYTTAVWCGYDLPQEINDGYGTTCSGAIWSQFMTFLHEQKKLIEFPGYVKEWEPENESGSESENEPGSESGEEPGSESGDEPGSESGEESSGEPVTDTTSFPNTSSEGEGTSSEGQTAPGGGELYTEYWS